MTQDNQEAERDKELVAAFTDAVRQLRRAYREWIQEELRSLASQCDFIKPLLAGSVEREVESLKRRRALVNQDERTECVNSLQGKIDEIEQGVYDSAFDAKSYMDEGLLRLEALVKELHVHRRRLAELYEAHTGGS